MRCPVDGAVLALTERNGVEIDYCPECRGVWLDRGELDRIIDRAAVAGPRYERQYDRGREHDRGRDDEHGWGQRPGRRRSGALSALNDLLGGGGD